MAESSRQYVKAHEIRTQLAALGMTEECVREAVEAGVADRRGCTPFDPPCFRGVKQWATTIRTLRELLAPKQWTSEDPANFSVVVSPDRAVAIAVTSGDCRTGIAGTPEPATKYPKGAKAEAAVRKNSQLPLWDEKDAHEDD